jgi:hypothetical protein
VVPIKEELDHWLSQHLPLITEDDAKRDISSHWVYRRHLLTNGNSSSHSRFILLEGFLILYRLKSSPLTRKWMETFFKQERIEYESQTLLEEEEGREKKKHKHKKRRLSPSPEPEVFVGWRFKKDESGLIYGITETPQYLHQMIVKELREWFIRSVQKG